MTSHRAGVVGGVGVVVVALVLPRLPSRKLLIRQNLLAEADRFAWLTDWYAALPIYSEVEKAATKAGSQRDALYAKFGRLRGQMQTLPLPDLSEAIALTSRRRRQAGPAAASWAHDQGRDRPRVGRPGGPAGLGGRSGTRPRAR